MEGVKIKQIDKKHSLTFLPKCLLKPPATVKKLNLEIMNNDLYMDTHTKYTPMF